jgi:hypothetical protein
MSEIIDAIQAAIAADATPEARAAGAHACRTLLATLEPSPPVGAPAIPPIAEIAAAFRGVPAEQLLDLAIAKLRAVVPSGADAVSVKPIAFQFVPVRRRG